MVWIICTIMILSLCACNKKGEQTVGTNEGDKLIWYINFQEQQDLEQVEAEINKVVAEKIGMEVDIRRIDPGSYSEKLKVMFGANEEFDLCWIGGSQYPTYASQGALMPLDDLLKEYAPKSYAQVPQEFWDATRINGKIYGFVNYQTVARQYGFVAQEEVLNQYNFNLDNIQKFEDIEPLLVEIQKNNPDDTPIAIFGSGLYDLLLGQYGMERVKDFCVVRTDDPELKVVNMYEQPEYYEFCKLMRDWYNKDLIAKDAASITNGLELRQKGVVKTWWDMTGLGFESTFQQSCGGRPVKTKTVVPPTVTTENITATMTGISRTSKHPEKAMQLLEMVNTNEGNIYNMLCFGIEGEHYNKVGDNRIEQIPDSGYAPNNAWAWGNQFNAYLLPGQADDLWEQTKAMNDSAKKSPLLGFTLNTDPIKIELSQISAVNGEFASILETGTVDPDETHQKFIDKMKVAGSDKVIEEVQKQIDAWRAQNQ